jgi:hypothetical protein
MYDCGYYCVFVAAHLISQWRSGGLLDGPLPVDFTHVDLINGRRLAAISMALKAKKSTTKAGAVVEHNSIVSKTGDGEFICIDLSPSEVPGEVVAMGAGAVRKAGERKKGRNRKAETKHIQRVGDDGDAITITSD